MKLFVIGSDVPCRRHDQDGVTAVHIVLYALIKALADAGHHIMFQCLLKHSTGASLTGYEAEALRHLAELGVMTLPLMAVPKPLPVTNVPGRLRQVVTPRMADFYPAIRLREGMRERLDASKPEAILTIWSPEGVAATHGYRAVPRLAYHGDVDFVPTAVRFKDSALFTGGSDFDRGQGVYQNLKSMYSRLRLSQFRRAHLRLMQDVNVIANVDAGNADFYAALGHPRSVYVQNVWSDMDAEALNRPASVKQPAQPIHIIGHVGYLNRTGSTYGLKFLLIDLLPVLDDVMAGLEYQVHIIGGGELSPGLQAAAKHARVVLHGYVQDLDSALHSSDVFLMLNNAGAYQAAYTRHVVAWSMGLCLIVHANSQKAIPEIAHMDNVLMGSTPVEIAHMIYRAVTDGELNRRIRQGGRRTYCDHFAPMVVAKTLSTEIGQTITHHAHS